MKYMTKGWRLETVYKHLSSLKYNISRDKIKRICRAKGIPLMSSTEDELLKETGKGLREVGRGFTGRYE